MKAKLILNERKSYIMKDNTKNNNPYAEARRKWAKEHAEPFLNIFRKIGEEMGADITPIQYVQAYKLCIEEYKFGYPGEYKLSELISTEETYEQTLAIMTEVMKRFRLAFQRDYKKQLEQRKRRAARKKAA